jgi:type IV secretion system protein TrbL
VLLGLSGVSMFRSYATSLLRYVLSVGFKLFVLNAVLFLGFNLVQDKLAVITVLTLEAAARIFVISLILLALIKALPDVVAGIIQGTHIGTGGNMTTTIHQVAHLTAGAALAGLAAMKNAPAAVSTAKTAVELARENGARGFGQTAMGTARNLWAARNDVKDDMGQSSMFRRMGRSMESKRETRNAADRMNAMGKGDKAE